MHIEHKLAVLSRIAQVFNENHIVWAVGASTLLYLKGMVDVFHDIDILVDEADAQTAKNLLSEMGHLHVFQASQQYKSKVFLEYTIDDVDIDMIAGFVIVSDNQEYYYPLQATDIEKTTVVNGETIATHCVDAWRTYYNLMGRVDKVKIIDRATGHAT